MLSHFRFFSGISASAGRRKKRLRKPFYQVKDKTEEQTSHYSAENQSKKDLADDLNGDFINFHLFPHLAFVSLSISY
jgi:hypothetical protein